MKRDRKVVHRKEQLLVTVERIYDARNQKGAVSVAIHHEHLDLNFNPHAMEEKIVKQPSWLAKAFGDSMESRLKRAIEEAKAKIAKTLETTNKEKKIEDAQSAIIDGFLEKIPSVDDGGMKRAQWRNLTKDK